MKTAFRQIRVLHCATVRENHARGLYGFHDAPSCPHCIKTDEGFRVHAGDSIFAPFVGYWPDADTVISPHPIYIS